FCAAVALLGIGVPVLVIAYWLVKGIAQDNSATFVADAVFNSAQASAMAAVGAALACLPVAMLSARYPGVVSGLLEKLSYTGQALPAITIALALVFFAAHYAGALYQTIWVLVFAYTVRFMPEALGATRNAILQVNPNT